MNYLKVSPSKVLILLTILCVVQFLIYVGTVSYYSVAPLGFPGELELIQVFDMDNEVSIPTWFSQFLFLGVSLLALLIYSAKRFQKEKGATYWLGIVLIFVYLSIDDGAALHENMSSLGWILAGSEGIFYYAWWVPMAIIVLILALLYLRFYLALPGKTQLLLALSFLIFVGGAIGHR